MGARGATRFCFFLEVNDRQPTARKKAHSFGIQNLGEQVAAQSPCLAARGTLAPVEVSHVASRGGTAGPWCWGSRYGVQVCGCEGGMGSARGGDD